VQYGYPTSRSRPACRARFVAAFSPCVSVSQRRELDRKSLRNPLAWIQAFPLEWDDWRREQVSLFVHAFARQSRQINPKLILSAAVYPHPLNAYRHKLQHWTLWLRRDWLDTVLPMAYDTDTKVVIQQMQLALQAADGRPVIGGIGAWRISPESTVNKIRALRRLGARGFCLFSYDTITQKGTSESYLNRIASVMNPS